MASKSIPIILFFFFSTISSLALISFAQTTGGDNGGGGGGSTSLPCVQKLLPCQASLVSHSNSPPPTCCVPLKQIIQDDPQCLCDVFNNPVLLKGLNITQQDALNLAKNCHATVDLSVCKTPPGNNPPSSPTPVTPSPPASSNSSTTTPSKSAASAGIEAMFAEKAAISLALFMLLSTIGFF